MLKIKKISDEDILGMLKRLPEIKKVEVLDFVDSLTERLKKEVVSKNAKNSVGAVKDTWGSIKVEKKLLSYIAEDKGLEYEI